MKMTRFSTKQQGIGLLELMLSLAIIAILLVMATRYFVVTSRSEQVNRAVTEIGMIQAGIANWKGPRPDYTGLTAQGLIDIGAIADGDIAGSGKSQTITTPWLGTSQINVGPTTTSTLNYVITLTNIPEWACQNLLQKYKGLSTITPNCSSTTLTLTSVGTF